MSRRKSQSNGLYIYGIAFLAFVLGGLTISLSIRACSHSKESNKEFTKYDNSKSDTDIESENEINYTPSYTMPDSIALICMPKPLEDVEEIVLHRTAYIVSYNKETKLPNWVAWNLTANHTDGPYRRLGNFYEDQEVPLPRATNDDYRGSGWSRGHMCPAGDNKWNEQAMFDTFSLTNVCPQDANLNSGLWNSIEMDCRRWARKYGDIFIVCGPVFFDKEIERIGAGQIAVPDAFFKVVLCLNEVPKGIGFIVRNTDGTKKRDLYNNSIDQVERITGMDFFPALPDDLEDAIESEADLREWN